MSKRINCIVDVVAPDLRWLEGEILNELFTTGKITMLDGRVKAIQRLHVLDYIAPSETGFQLTRAGLGVAITNYMTAVANGTVFGDAVVNYFRCLTVPTYTTQDLPQLACSNTSTRNYVDMLAINGNLSVISGDERIYKLVDFIDEFTGESHILHPDDTVVLSGNGHVMHDGPGYVIHKFSE